MKVSRKTRGVVGIICLALAQIVLPAEAETVEETVEVAEVAEDGTDIQFISFGDSIAKGYTYDRSELSSYPALVQGDIQQEADMAVVLTNTAKNGITTVKLNETILVDEQVLAILSNADLITVTIGANDLMDEFKNMCQEILGRSEKFKGLNDALELLEEEVKSRPTLVFKVIGALSNWDYESFEGNWKNTMEIMNIHKKNSAQIVVTNIYNPVEGLELPETMAKVAGSIIKKMNEIIEDNAKIYNYTVVNLFDSSISEHVQVDGLHPDQEGQQLIADAVMEKVDISVLLGSHVGQEDIDADGSVGLVNGGEKEKRKSKNASKSENGREYNDGKDSEGADNVEGNGGNVAGWGVACIGITGVLLIMRGVKKEKKE